jgi:hypothetical protein
LSNETAVVPESLNQRIIEDTASIPHSVKTNSQLYLWFGQGRMFSFRTVGLAFVLSILLSALFSTLWYNSMIKTNQTIVCLSPLPEVEVVGYIITPQQPIEGILQ